jgi:RHS repeat-associated protein
MIEDLNKNVTIAQYNYLNLPQQLNMNPDGTDEINYLYTANGQKLMKQTRTDNVVEQTVDYAGNFVYEDNVLKYILTGEGRVIVNNNGTYEYQYSLKDHPPKGGQVSGNTRITFNQNGQIIQEDAYYPFGMKMNGLFYETGTDYKNKYLYNGKELQEDHNLNWYDYGARMYDPQIGRWHTMDNKAEKYTSLSPYNYAINNPINVIDPDGNDIYVLTWYSKDGETGHAGIAVDNYKTVEKKDAKGNTIVDKNGKPVTEQVKDGTMTYYDLWPESPVGKTELQSNVTDDYNGPKVIKSLSDLKNTDVSKSGEAGKVSQNGEGRAADGIVQITTNYAQDSKATTTLTGMVNSGKDYNGAFNNCSSFVQNGLKSVFPSFDASQMVRPSFPLNQMYNDARVVAPNNLYNAALKIKGATNIKGPSSVQAKPYLEYFGKSNRTP